MCNIMTSFFTIFWPLLIFAESPYSGKRMPGVINRIKVKEESDVGELEEEEVGVGCGLPQ